MQRPFTVIAFCEETGQSVCDHVMANNGIHAFWVAAQDRPTLTMVVAIPGHLSEGAGDLVFPGQGVVDAATVLEQPEVFGPIGESPTAVDEKLLTPEVSAEVHNDSHSTQVKFDAAAWFAQADEAKIIALHGIGWTGDSASDAVAQFFEDRNEDIADLFNFCRATQLTREPQGFECSVDEDDAMAWLKQHRPGLWARLLCQDNDVRLVEAEEEEIRGMWDWLDDQGNACDCSFATIEEAALNAVEVLELAP